MTRDDLRSELYYIVADWHKVEKIFQLFGKLSPEPKVKPQPPTYKSKQVRRVGRGTKEFTQDEMADSKTFLAMLDLL